MTTLEQQNETFTYYGDDGSVVTISLEEWQNYSPASRNTLQFLALCELIASLKPTLVESQFPSHLIRRYLKYAHIEWFIEANVDPVAYEQNMRFNFTGPLKLTAEDIIQRTAFPQIDSIALLFSGGKDSIAALAALRMRGVNPQCYYFFNRELGPSPWFTLLAAYLKDAKELCIQSNPIPHYHYHLENKIVPSWDYLSMALAIVGAHHSRVALGSDVDVAQSYGKYHGCDIQHQYDKTVAHCNFILSKVGSTFDAPLQFSTTYANMHLASVFLQDSWPWKYIVSCNNFTSSTRWCNQCAKCAYTQLLAYVVLDAECFAEFTGARELNEHLVREQLRDFVNGGERPLECIGTRMEIIDLLKRARLDL
jgi:hypothetical protein